MPKRKTPMRKARVRVETYDSRFFEVVMDDAGNERLVRRAQPLRVNPFLAAAKARRSTGGAR